jgi:hypothetical protein
VVAVALELLVAETAELRWFELVLWPAELEPIVDVTFVAAIVGLTFDSWELSLSEVDGAEPCGLEHAKPETSAAATKTGLERNEERTLKTLRKKPSYTVPAART